MSLFRWVVGTALLFGVMIVKASCLMPREGMSAVELRTWQADLAQIQDQRTFFQTHAPQAFVNLSTQALSHVTVHEQARSLQETWAQFSTLEFLEALGRYARNYLHVDSLVVTALTTPLQMAGDSHCFHASGYAFDIRPLNGKKPTSWKDKVPHHYHREATYQLIRHLVDSKEVLKVYFNDPRLLDRPELQAKLEFYRGHDNHIHVQLQPVRKE